MISRLSKNDKMYGIFCGLYALVCYARYFDHSLAFHSAPMGIMQDYHFAMLATAVCEVVLLALLLWILGRTPADRKRDVYYVGAIFLSTFYAFFWTDSYFGATDLYAWTLFALSIVIAEQGRLSWLTLPAMLAMGLISPMSIFTLGAWFLLYLAMQYVYEERKDRPAQMLCIVIVLMIGFVVSRKLGYFQTDAQGRITVLMCICVLLALSPYAVMIAKFLMGFRGKTEDSKEKAIAALFAGLPLLSLLVWACLGDYARGICYGIGFYGVFFALLMGKKYDGFLAAWDERKEAIKKIVPLPWVLVLIPVMIVALALLGRYVNPAETLLAN